MAKLEHLENIRQGIEVWNRWKIEHPEVLVDLRDADLRRFDLSGVNLQDANLRGADLGEANMRDADLRRAILVDSNLSRADLTHINLRRASLINANLTEANLSSAFMLQANLHGARLSRAILNDAIVNGVNFSKANFVGASFYRAHTAWTIFTDVDLSSVEGLETVRHVGPSSVGIDTIYRSKGNIPHNFLRGCGVPEELINMVNSLMNPPLEINSCFISYSHKDEEFARLLHQQLSQKGLRVWFAPENVQGGRKLHDEIDRAIQLHEKVLLVLSENSLKSDWVMTEILKVRQQETRQMRRKLFPIRITDFKTISDWHYYDADTGKDIATEVRQYYIPDFSHWRDPEAFEGALNKLYRDLTSEMIVTK